MPDATAQPGTDQNPELFKAVLARIFGAATPGATPGATPPFFGSSTANAASAPAAGGAPAPAGMTSSAGPSASPASTEPSPTSPGYRLPTLSSSPGAPVPSAATAPPAPVLSESEWSRANPAPEHTPYVAPDLKHRMLEGLFAGMQEFGRPGEGAATVRDYIGDIRARQEQERNYPVTSADLAHKRYMEYAAGQKAPIDIQDVQSQIHEREAQAEERRAKAAAERRGNQRLQHVVIDDPASPGSPRAASYNPATGEFLDTETGHVIQNAKPYEKPVTDTGKIDPLIEAQIGARPDPKDYPKGASDPAYQTKLRAWGRAGNDILVARQASQGESRGKSFGRNRPTQVLDTWNGNRPVVVSAGDAEDNPERYATQTGGAPALKEERQFADIRDGIEEVKRTAGVLDQGFDNRALIAAGLAQPQTSFSQWLMGEMGKGHLNESQADYVTALQSLWERVMAIRGLTGGGQGEDLRAAIRQAIPGPGTPTKGFADKQLNQLNRMVNNLERGTPKVPLRPDTNAPATPGAANPKDPLGIY
jgi:hypothetical protein